MGSRGQNSNIPSHHLARWGGPCGGPVFNRDGEGFLELFRLTKLKCCGHTIARSGRHGCWVAGKANCTAATVWRGQPLCDLLGSRLDCATCYLGKEGHRTLRCCFELYCLCVLLWGFIRDTLRLGQRRQDDDQNQHPSICRDETEGSGWRQ